MKKTTTITGIRMSAVAFEQRVEPNSMPDEEDRHQHAVPDRLELHLQPPITLRESLLL